MSTLSLGFLGIDRHLQAFATPQVVLQIGVERPRRGPFGEIEHDPLRLARFSIDLRRVPGVEAVKDGIVLVKASLHDLASEQSPRHAWPVLDSVPRGFVSPEGA